MTEKVKINGKDIWIMIEPHVNNRNEDAPQEYFTASYYSLDPATNPGGILLTGEDQSPLTFDSPVEALEYANEKLLGLV